MTAAERHPEPLPGAPAVRLQGVSCRRSGRLALERVTLDMERGQVTGILGPNGAGKSTLLGIITGLRSFFEGEASVLGQTLPARGTALRRRIGVVLQETALYDELTTHQNLSFAAALYGVHNPDRRIGEVLELLSLSDRAREVVGTLSGGLRRRVTMARALLHEPELLIIDEPTLGVDAEARHAIWAHVRLIRAGGTTIVVATNYLDEAQAFCDKAAVLRGGRLVAYETPESLVARAGQCIDVQCEPAALPAIDDVVAGVPGVIRTEATPSGAAVYVRGDLEPDEVMRMLLPAVHIGGFRVRGADLAEVFRVLEPAAQA